MAGCSCADIAIWIVLGVIVCISAAMIFPIIVPTKREYFMGGYPTKQLCKMPMTTLLPELSGPADATLQSPRAPYHLLGDYMKPALDEPTERIANFSSESAYMSDAQRYIEKTGSYGKITNNYRHKGPDNGSTWLHELSVSFYR